MRIMIYDDINVMEERHAPYPFLHLNPPPPPPPPRENTSRRQKDPLNGMLLVFQYIFKLCHF